MASAYCSGTPARNSHRLAELMPARFMALSARSMISVSGLPSETGTKTLGYRGISPFLCGGEAPTPTWGDNLAGQGAGGARAVARTPQRGTVRRVPDISGKCGAYALSASFSSRSANLSPRLLPPVDRAALL